MPAAFEDPPPERQKPPPPPPKFMDDDVSTVGKMIGSGCVALCTCGLGIIFIVYPYGFLGPVGLVLSAIGLYAVYYSWKAAGEGSEW